jgi:hypothetical protein
MKCCQKRQSPGANLVLNSDFFWGGDGSIVSSILVIAVCWVQSWTVGNGSLLPDHFLWIRVHYDIHRIPHGNCQINEFPFVLA